MGQVAKGGGLLFLNIRGAAACFLHGDPYAHEFRSLYPRIQPERSAIAIDRSRCHRAVHQSRVRPSLPRHRLSVGPWFSKRRRIIGVAFRPLAHGSSGCGTRTARGNRRYRISRVPAIAHGERALHPLRLLRITRLISGRKGSAARVASASRVCTRTLLNITSANSRTVCVRTAPARTSHSRSPAKFMGAVAPGPTIHPRNQTTFIL